MAKFYFDVLVKDLDYRKFVHIIPSLRVERNANYNKYGFSARCLETNLPPDVPSNPSPENGAINQPVNITLSWTCTDPEDDPLTFDIYFGTGSDPPLEAEGITEFSLLVENLNCPNYYWKIVAYDDHNNITIGPVWNFKTTSIWECGCSFEDDRDGQPYNTIQIADQCWMAENLNIGSMIEGTYQTNNGIIEKYCYDNLESNCDTYGGLYQWDEIMQYTTTQGAQGICPIDWHLPTDAEWCTLENYVDAGTVSCTAIGFRGIDAGLNLKSTTGWYSGGNGTDLYGFTVLPGGHWSYIGDDFLNLGRTSYFWSSTECTIYGWYRILDYNYDGIDRYITNKLRGFSSRCLKD